MIETLATIPGRVAALGAVVGGGVMLLAAAGSAQAATTVGQNGPVGECGSGYRWTQETTAAPPAYTIPGPGVITSFTYLPLAAGEQTRLLILEGSGTTYTAVAKSDFETASSAGLQTFPTALPVHAGQRIGSYGSDCVFSGAAGDVARFEAGADPPLGVPMSYATTSSASRLNLSATLEPDADNDGFGDETQDRCPAEASTSGGPCSRTLTLDSNKGKVEKRKNVRLSGQVEATGNDPVCEASQTIEIVRTGLKGGAPKPVTTDQTDAQGNFARKVKVRKSSLYTAQVGESSACERETSDTEKVRVQKPKAAQEA